MIFMRQYDREKERDSFVSASFSLLTLHRLRITDTRILIHEPDKMEELFFHSHHETTFSC